MVTLAFKIVCHQIKFKMTRYIPLLQFLMIWYVLQEITPLYSSTGFLYSVCRFYPTVLCIIQLLTQNMLGELSLDASNVITLLIFRILFVCTGTPTTFQVDICICYSYLYCFYFSYSMGVLFSSEFQCFVYKYLLMVVMQTLASNRNSDLECLA